MVTPAGDALGMPHLLGRAVVAFAQDAAAAAPADAALGLRTWANLVRPLDGATRTMRELHTASRLSRRAMRTSLRGLERHGWVTTAGSGAARTVSLTCAGEGAAAAWRPVPARVEDSWRRSLGADRVDGLRDALVRLVARLAWELPHHPATYGTFDATVTGGPGVDRHGADWRPVPRTDRGAVAGLPLHALLSQAVLGFAIDYEAEGHGPYATATTVLRYLGDGVTPLAATPFRHRLSPQARYTLRTAGLATLERDPATGAQGLRATARGRRCRDAHAPAVARVTRAWRHAHGRRAVDELTAAASALACRLPPDLPDYPLDA